MAAFDHNDAQLREDVERMAALLVDTGTGGQTFQAAGPEYEELEKRTRGQCKRLGIPSPFPWRTLWEWHGHYSQRLSTYSLRRVDVSSRVSKFEDSLEAVADTIHDPGSTHTAPNWDALSRRIDGLTVEYSRATSRDDWQDVGRRSREILIDLGRILAAEAVVADGQVCPKVGDARAWFDLFMASWAGGRERKEMRATMRASWDLAQKVTHGDIDSVDAYAAAQATVLVVRAVEKLVALQRRVQESPNE